MFGLRNLSTDCKTPYRRSKFHPVHPLNDHTGIPNENESADVHQMTSAEVSPWTKGISEPDYE
jgi:hypothetical protein